MVGKEKIEAVKHGVDLVALVESRGITLKKNGKGWFGLCPFHDDKNPSLSVNPEKNLWQCFGCGAAGDAIRFVELFDQVDFPEAVNRLFPLNGSAEQAGCGLQPKKPKPKPTPDPPLSAKQKKLLARVVAFYHTAFGEDPRAREYLKARGITDNAVLSAHKAGFANGTLLNVLPVADPANGGDDGDLIDRLKEIGIPNQRGKEHFYGCVSFPLYDANGDPAGIHGRRMDDTAHRGSARHLYLTGQRLGLFNRQAAMANREIILTESVIDSLTLIDAGIHDTIPAYGINGLTDDHLQWFKQCGVTMVHVCFDADDAGRQAAERTMARLASEGFKTHRVNLPDGQDINDFFLLTAPISV